MFFGLEFGTTYHLLESDLDPATRASWQASLAAAANYLIDSGDTTWYANGNINLGYTEFLYLVWQATGNTTYEQAYSASWNFTMGPPQNRFPGSGLVITQQPTQADGSDGMAYLTESGAGGNGFDADYTQTQLDTACRLYLLSGDPRALRLANMLLNTLMPRVNTSTWMLDTSGGTRHTEQGREDGFMTSAFAVLGLDGGRSCSDPGHPPGAPAGGGLVSAARPGRQCRVPPSVREQHRPRGAGRGRGRRRDRAPFRRRRRRRPRPLESSRRRRGRTTGTANSTSHSRKRTTKHKKPKKNKKNKRRAPGHSRKRRRIQPRAHR